ncbi:MAG: DUF177 domain-containing protein [Candidatus Latescibacteria bacterium]|nr:DUF177 domain-containing protein [Candidatus Latescibacterota bacterium]
MKIDLYGVSEQKDRIEFDCDAGNIEIPEGEFTLDSPVTVTVDLNESGELVYAKGRIVASIAIECVRCLESFHKEIDDEFSFVVKRLKQGEPFPDGKIETEEIDEEDIIFISHDQKALDITEFVHDALLLSIPSKPVCCEKCKGLCPQCGQNLNIKDCHCSNQNIDPRWQSLKSLFDDNSDI